MHTAYSGKNSLFAAVPAKAGCPPVVWASKAQEDGVRRAIAQTTGGQPALAGTAALFAWAAAFLLALILLPPSSFALDSSVNTPLTIIPMSTNTPPTCSYYFIDTYDGTVLPGGTGSDPAPTGTAIALQFYNNVYNSLTMTTASSPTLQSTRIPCAGTFEVVFSIELQANTNVATLVVTPQVKDTVGTTLYPAVTGSPTTTLYPQCNNTGYAATPYCTVGWVSGAVQVQLPVGDYVLAPTLTTDSSVTVLGGQLEIFFLHP